MGKPIVFFDLETGGLCPYPHTNSKGMALKCSVITQIAAAAVDRDTLEILSAFECKILFKPESADDTALEMNHYDAAVWEREAIHPAKAASEFAAWLRPFQCLEKTSKAGRPYTIAEGAGHNAHRFDGPLLMAWAKALCQFMPLDHLVLDTLALARAWTILRDIPVGNTHRLKGYKSTELADYFGIDKGNAHDAMDDVYTCIAIYGLLREAIMDAGHPANLKNWRPNNEDAPMPGTGLPSGDEPTTGQADVQ